MIAEYKKKLENDRPVLNLVVIGELLFCVMNKLYCCKGNENSYMISMFVEWRS